MKIRDQRQPFQLIFIVSLIGGFVFFGIQLFCSLLDTLLSYAIKLLNDLDVLVAALLIFCGIMGLLWLGLKPYFGRWYNNKTPISGDTIVVGFGFGAFIATVIQLLSSHSSLFPSLAVPICVFFACSMHCLLLIRKRRKHCASKTQNDSALADEPLANLTEQTDAFGRMPFVSAFSSAIQRSEPNHCHVFGLVGAWGSGKTSVVRAVSDILKSSFHIIEIDSWAFRDTGRLTEAVLTSIVQKVNENYFFPDLKKSVSRYLSIISPVTKDLPFFESLANVLASSDEVENLKAKIESAIEATGDRFLVLIDDVDRLDTTELQSLLKTVRLRIL